MDYIQNLQSTSQWITIIVGSGLFVLDIIEALANLVIFFVLDFEKQHVVNIFSLDLVYIGFILASLIAIDGFNISTYFTFDSVCQLHNYLGTLLTCMSLWCKCLAAFDRWASTSQYVNIRLWSNVKRGHILLGSNCKSKYTVKLFSKN